MTFLVVASVCLFPCICTSVTNHCIAGSDGCEVPTILEQDFSEDEDSSALLQTSVTTAMEVEMNLKQEKRQSDAGWMLTILKNGIPIDVGLELLLLVLGVAIVCDSWLRPSNDDQMLESTNEAGIPQQVQYRAAIMRHDCGTIIMRNVNVWLQYIAIFMFMAVNSALIPASYDISRDMGGNAAVSGFLVGTMYMPMIAGFLLARVVMKQSQWFKRRFTSGCFFGVAGLTFVTSVVLSPTFSNVGTGPRWFVLIGARAGLGLMTAGMVARRMMIQSILPAAANVEYNTYLNLAIAVGIGGGPAAASFLCWVFSCHDSFAKVVVPFRMMAAVCFLVASLWFAWTPDSLQALLAAKEARDAKDAKVEAEQRKSSNSVTAGTFGGSKVSPTSRQCRQCLWVTALILGAERAMTSSALEVATALLLEVQYGLHVSTIGYLVGAAFTIGLPTIVIMDRVRHAGCISSETTLLVYGVMCAVAAPFLFTQVGIFVQQHCKFNRWTTLLFADFLMFPASFAMNGIADAIAMNASEAGSFCSQENYLVAAGILQNSISRAFSPPLARHLVTTGGQNAYASFQVIVVGLAFMKVLAIWRQSGGGSSA